MTEPVSAIPSEDPQAPGQAGSRRKLQGLSLAAFVLVALWATSLLVFALPSVLNDVVIGLEAHVALGFVSIFAFMTGLNVWLAALVVGIVAIVRSGRWRALRSSLFVVLLVGGVVVPYWLSGWRLSGGEGDDDDVFEPTNMPARGLAIWGLAGLVVLVCWALLRESGETATAAPRDRRAIRRRVLLSGGVAGVVVLAFLAWLHQAGRPGLDLHNDTSQTLGVQVCPLQECSGEVIKVNEGERHRLVLDSPPVPQTHDSLRVTAGEELMGCLLIDRDPREPARQWVALSLADPEIC